VLPARHYDGSVPRVPAMVLGCMAPFRGTLPSSVATLLWLWPRRVRVRPRCRGTRHVGVWVWQAGKSRRPVHCACVCACGGAAGARYIVRVKTWGRYNLANNLHRYDGGPGDLADLACNRSVRPCAPVRLPFAMCRRGCV
jgi:hypothetical protein